MLICQMAKWYKAQGMTLAQAMQALYEEFGYYQNSLHSVSFEGQSRLEQMQKVMESLRNDSPRKIAGFEVQTAVDYLQRVVGLPPSNVLEYRLENGAKVILRPSGTEPKLKLYLFSRGVSLQEAKDQLEQLKTGMEKYLK